MILVILLTMESSEQQMSQFVKCGTKSIGLTIVLGSMA